MITTHQVNFDIAQERIFSVLKVLKRPTNHRL